LVSLKVSGRNQKIFICGSIGDFYRQFNYFDDFHVLFNQIYSSELALLGINIEDSTCVPPAALAQIHTLPNLTINDSL
jgi:hypothetical protein